VPFHAAQGQSDEPPPRLPAVTHKLGIAQNLPLLEYEFAKANTDRAVKVTLAGMTYASVLWVPGISDEAYPDRAQYMASPRAHEADRQGGRGRRGDYVQLDSPRYTHLVSEEGQENLRRVGLDTETWLGQMIEYDNELISAFPDVTFAVHLCRGITARLSVEGGYDAIAEQLFNDLACDRILAEYDSPAPGPSRRCASCRTTRWSCSA